MLTIWSQISKATSKLKSNQVYFLTNSTLNVFSNIVPNKVIKIRDKDAPRMRTVDIMKIVLAKEKIYRKYDKGANHIKCLLRNVTSESATMIKIKFPR